MRTFRTTIAPVILAGFSLMAASADCLAQSTPVEITGGTFEVGFSINAYNGYDGSVSRDSGGTFFQDPNFFTTLSDTVGGSVEDILPPGSASASASNTFSMTTTQDVANDNNLKIVGSGSGQVEAMFSNPATQFGYTSAGAQIRTLSNVNFTTYEPVSFDITAALVGNIPNGRAEIRLDTYSAETDDGQFDFNESGVLQPGDHALYYLVFARPNAVLNGGSATNNAGLDFEINLGPADDAYHWKNAGGGNFGTHTNWNPEAIPPSDKTIIFDLPDTYTVNLNQDRTVHWANVKAGDVTFDVSANTLTIDDRLVIGAVANQAATVRVSNPENFDVQGVIVGVAENADAKFILGPPSAAASLRGAAAQSSSFSPVLFPIAVVNQGKLEIMNQTCTLPELSVTPVAYPDTGQNQPDTVRFVDSEITVQDEVNFSSTLGDEAGSSTGTVTHTNLSMQRFKMNAFNVKVHTAQIKTLTMHLGATNHNAPLGAQLAPSQTTILISESTLEAENQLTVGDNQPATMEVTEGSNVETPVAILGSQTGSFGQFTIGSNTAQKSTITANQLDIGRDGGAQMHVMAGGQAIVSTLARIVGQDDGGDDEAEILAAFTDPPTDPPIDPPTGELIVDDGGYFFATQIDVGPSGAVSGTGLIETVDGLNFDGTLKPGASPGTLNIIGPVNQGENGVIEIEIAGATPGQEYDVLNITGHADLNGAIALIFNGYSPRQGDIFDFLNIDGIADLTDATFETRNLLPGFEYSAQPTETGFRVLALNDGTFVPEPATAGLALACLATIAARPRRQV